MLLVALGFLSLNDEPGPADHAEVPLTWLWDARCFRRHRATAFEFRDGQCRQVAGVRAQLDDLGKLSLLRTLSVAQPTCSASS